MLTYVGRRKTTPNGQGANLSYNMPTAVDRNLSLTVGLLIAQARHKLPTAEAAAFTGATVTEKECIDALGDRGTDTRQKRICAEENVFSAPATRDSVY